MDVFERLSTISLLKYNYCAVIGTKTPFIVPQIAPDFNFL